SRVGQRPVFPRRYRVRPRRTAADAGHERARDHRRYGRGRRTMSIHPARALLPALVAAVLSASASAGDALRIDGEVYALRAAQLMPPMVDRMWQFNITQLAPDGTPVKQGEPVLAFDSGQLTRDLTEKQSKLQEKQRELEKLLLDLSERERTERLATAEARAALDKAQRKTEQPRELIAAMQYDKLIEERRRAERRMALAQVRERLSAEQHRQERRLAESEVAQ